MINTTTTSHSRLFTFFMIFCAALGGILYGYDIGVISGALLFVKKTIPMTRLEIGVIVGAVLTGGMLSTFITGPLADRFGRRTMILVACLVFIIGICTILMAHTFFSLFVARLLLGIAVGIVAVAVPLYLTETAPAKLRGRSLTLFQLFLTLGILLAYLIDLFFTSSGNWRAMFAVLFIPVSILFFSMLILPETPRWLLAKRRDREALKVLSKIRPYNKVKKEIEQIKASLSVTHSNWKALFARNFWLPLFVVISIAILNQLTGINVLLQYAPVVIQKAGLTSKAGIMLSTVGMGAINLFGTVISFFLIDYFGRRRLLIIGTLGIIISYLYLGGLSTWLEAGKLQADLSLIGLFSYIIFYAIGPGVVVWLAISELMPTKVRGKAVALGLFVNSLTAALLSTLFLPLMHQISMGRTYDLFALFTGFYFLVAFYLLPETRGKSLEEIQQFYQKFVLKKTHFTGDAILE